MRCLRGMRNMVGIVGIHEVKVLGGLSMLMLKFLRMMAENEVDRESVSQVVKFLRNMTTAQPGALLHQEG